MVRTTIDSFMEKVFPEPNTGCWLWSGKIHPNGYGAVSNKVHGFRTPHRLSYFLHNGEFDRSLHVCHTCDNRSCVNPDHLFLGTAMDNMIDCVRKGRNIKGTQCHKAKLNEALVSQIKVMYKTGLYTKADLGREYGVSDVMICNIINNKNWKHVN